MAHSLILGMTESGKTTLAKNLAKEYRYLGYKTLVLDPIRDPGWGADYMTDDPDEFLGVFFDGGTQRCMVFIDEAGDVAGRYDTAMVRTATRGRHWGHSVHYISQRGTQIARTIRDQCSHLFLFCTALADSKIHANEWNNTELLTAPQLQQGAYLYCTRFGRAERGG